MAANSANAVDDKLIPTKFYTELKKEVDGKLKVIRDTGYLDTLVTNQVIMDVPTGTTMDALFGVYRADLVDYSGCENEMFGKDGEHTELMCKLESVRDIFSTDEELPVKDRPLRPFQAAKSSYFGDEDKMARTYCEEETEFSAKDCPDDDMARILPNIRQLQGLVQNYVPDGYDNALLSYGMGLSDPNKNNIRSNFLMGDGFFQMLEIVLNKDAFAFECTNRICLMEGFILLFIMNLYILNNTGIKNDGLVRAGNRLYAILTGYLYQGQSKKIHRNRKDRAVMTKVFTMTHKCQYFTGVLIKQVCGVGIEKTLKVIDELNILDVSPTEKCPIKPKMMRKVAGIITEGKKNKKVKTISECVRKLKRFHA